jgi:transcriptional regulator with XRE-family HTH domain
VIDNVVMLETNPAHGHSERDADLAVLWDALRAVGLTVASVPRTKSKVASDRDYLKRLGEVIVEVRVIRGVSQAQLAEAIGKSEAALSRWENGKAAADATDLRLIRTSIGMPSRWFFEPPVETVSEVLLEVACAAEEGLSDGLLEAGSPNRLRPFARRLRPRQRRPSAEALAG